MRSLFTPLPTALLRTSVLAAALAATLSACGDSSNASDIPAKLASANTAPRILPAVAAQITEYALAQANRQHIPGMSVVVTHHGHPVFMQGFGVTDLATGAPATPDSVYRIGSVTKQFTASAIMLLVQEGRITLDQPVHLFLPGVPPSWNGITIRHLLNHTSGLARDFPASLFVKIDQSNMPAIDQLVTLAADAPLAYPTGEEQQYSNVGYHMLGFVIEKVTGQHYAEFMQTRFFRPLGMTTADVIRTTRPVPGMARGYTWDGTALGPASTYTMTPGLVEAEGGLQMSAMDLARWDAALHDGRILSKASQAQMWEPARLNNGSTVAYGFGWVLDAVNDRPFQRHDGLVEGFTSQLSRYTNEGYAVIVLANTDSAATQRVASRIGAMVDRRFDWFTTADPHPATAVLLRTAIEEAARGVLQADQRFAPSFQAMLTQEVLHSFTAYLEPWGAIEHLGYIDKVSLNGMQVARYLMRDRYDQAVIGIALDEQGRIAYLGLLSE